MSFAEYVEWQAYAAIEPFGDPRADLRAAMIAAASQAPHVKGSVDLSRFLLFSEDRFEEARDQTEDEMDQVLERVARG